MGVPPRISHRISRRHSPRRRGRGSGWRSHGRPGVNIAARLEGIAEPGEIVLSGAAYEQARDRVKKPFRRTSMRPRSGTSARPVRVYAHEVERTRRLHDRGEGRKTRAAAPLARRAATVRQCWRRSGAGIFRRWRYREPDHRSHAYCAALSIISQLDGGLYLQEGKAVDLKQFLAANSMSTMCSKGACGARKPDAGQCAMIEAETGAHPLGRTLRQASR